MNTNYKQIKSYISSIEKYKIKSKELDENNNEIENISINYKLLNEDINNIDKDLISNLIKNKLCKELFFDKIEDVYVFNQNSFIEVMFNTNEYMEGSYTKYSSDIGLFLKDEDKIQLNFPYKDCVLVGGMDKEDDKVNLEVFYNEILEKDKINKLFEPKVFHNIKKYSYSKELAENDKLDNPNNIQIDNDIDAIKFETIEEDGIEKQKLKDNLLIKGNNLLGLHSLAKRLSGSIDVIYIDPPYYFNQTKASDSFAYNSNFKLSTWLTFMKNRLEIAKELLSDTGVIFISMNEDGNSHLKLLCDDVFGVDNFVSNFSWIFSKQQLKENNKIPVLGVNSSNLKKSFENILLYGKKSTLKENTNRLTEVRITSSNGKEEVFEFPKGLKLKRFSNNELRELNETFKIPKSIIGGEKEYCEIINEEGIIIKDGILINDIKLKYIPRSRNIINKLIKNEIVFDNKGNKYIDLYITKSGKPYILKQLNQSVISNVLSGFGDSSISKDELNKLKIDFTNGKPSELIKYLLNISSNENSTILDFFAGSGTTAHSVLSLNKEDEGNRKFILLEQMDYIESITSERIKRCMIKECYEDSFIYMEMKESNIKELKNSIKSSKSKEELISLINDNFNNGYFINIDNKEQILLKIEEIHSKTTKNSNPLNDSIKLVIEKHMDNNLDYVSYEDIEELKQSNQIKENEYKLNKSFYEEV